MSITIRRLVHVYGTGVGAVTALEGLDLDIADAEIYVVRGPNGSGKSTLVGILTGELTPTAGSVRISRADDTAPRVATVRQFANLVDGLRVHEHFALLGGSMRGDALPGELVQRDVATLSRGERQLVAVALSLSLRPDVLLVDEPTAALSPAESDRVYDFIADNARAAGTTVLLVTHDARAERIADHVLSLRDGRVSEAWSGSEDPHQVIDSLGWLRLPDDVRDGMPSRVRVHATDDGAGIAGRIGRGQSDAPVVRERSASPEMCVDTTGLVCSYGGVPAVGPVDMRVRRGAVHAVTGASGTGKTTLLRATAGLHAEHVGDVTVTGAVAYFDPDAPFGSELTVRELVVDPRIVAALGLGDLTERRLRTLSGGQRQRAIVAMALAHERPIVLLDEPTSALDDMGCALVLDAIAASDKTFVIATHDDRVLAIATGNTALDERPRGR